jgi:transcriptional regulator with XRE-family HTH domain
LQKFKQKIGIYSDLVLRVKLAVKHNGFLRQQDLVEEVGLASSTVRNFLNGKRVNYATFVELCQRLNLEWRDFADTGEITELHRESEEAVIAQYSTSDIGSEVAELWRAWVLGR